MATVLGQDFSLRVSRRQGGEVLLVQYTWGMSHKSQREVGGEHLVLGPKASVSKKHHRLHAARAEEPLEEL